MSTPTHAWRPSDLEAIRVALRIPVSPASIRVINDEMAALERTYPDAIPAAKAHLDAIALIDTPPPPGEPGGQLPAEPVIRKVTRKGAAGPVPEQLPQKKLDVIEYATELLLEEVSTEYAIPADATSAAAAAADPARQRQRHVEQLLLILPRLEGWMPRPRSLFEGQMIRG
ncbi:hypothetical protein KBY96_14075 [Cyanobium sp. ATX 6A2]|uniref:hypothetical protein n=1 Tax=Cyanobium sp. ATX 6A2 TaxID=2823700 RepID=UPI0020CC5FFF|nr:hypothetical protein [Cyanobium sp. ATX 6A2]MCP9889050.1 hypothetical protein [Cyanobium sp. ATX 6A2]